MSERPLSSSVLTELGESDYKLAILVYGDFPQGEVRFWSGYGPLLWDGSTYTGTLVPDDNGNFNTLLGLSLATETTDQKSSQAVFTMAGIPNSLNSQIADYDWQGNQCSAHLAFFDNNFQLISDPVVLFVGQMDSDEAQDDGEAFKVSITARNRMADVLRQRTYRFDHESQTALYASSGDAGFEFVSDIQTKELKWAA